MTFSDTEMKKLGRGPSDTHNKRLFIRISQVCHRSLAVGRSQQVKEYKHTHTHTRTHTHTHTHTHTQSHTQRQQQLEENQECQRAEAVVQRCSLKMVFLEISQNLQENTCTRICFLIKETLLKQTLLKKRLRHRCFPVNLVKFLRTAFFIERLWWLLLKVRTFHEAIQHNGF